MAAKKKGRGSAWTNESTECLLAIWQEKNVEEQLEDPKKNCGSIYQMISKEMTKQGHERNAVQCKVRMHTLKRSFRECKKKQNTSGKGRNLCKFYHQLNEILGQRPATSPVKLLESMGSKRRLTMDDSSNAESCNEDEDPVHLPENDDDNTRDDESMESNPEQTPTQIPDDDTPMPQASDAKNEKSTNESDEKEEKGKKKMKSGEKKQRKSRLELALGSVMSGFAESSSKFETTLVSLETKKLDAEIKRLELERQKIDSDERQRREERNHQYRMMEMIIGRTQGHPPGQPSPHGADWSSSSSPHNYNQNQSRPSSSQSVIYDDAGQSYFNM